MRLTPTAYARHRGCSASYIRQLCREGRLERDRDGLIDAELADRALGPRRQPSPQRADFLEERAKRERVRCRREALALERERSRLVDAEDARRAANEQASRVRATLSGLPDRLAPLIAAETDPHRVHQLMTDELRAALESLSGG